VLITYVAGCKTINQSLN